MCVPRATSLITQVEGLEADLEPVPKVNKRNFFVSCMCKS